MNYELKGKTILTIDSSCTNYWVVEFTDGTKVAIEADTEFIGNGMSMPIVKCIMLNS